MRRVTDEAATASAEKPNGAAATHAFLSWLLVIATAGPGHLPCWLSGPGLSQRLVWSKTAFLDEATHTWVGRSYGAR